MIIRCLQLVSISFLLCGCYTTYYVSYEARLANGRPDSVSYEDDDFRFAFEPVVNGVYFAVENKTDTTATILWDRSYFIGPSLSASGALNADLILTPDKVRAISRNESLVPRKSYYSRFTTSTNNIAALYDFSENAGYFSRTFSSGSLSKVSYEAALDKFYQAGSFLPVKVEVDKTSGEPNQSGLSSVTDVLRRDNKMALGLTLRLGRTEKEYRFDFVFCRAFAFKLLKAGNVMLQYVATNDEWLWRRP